MEKELNKPLVTLIIFAYKAEQFIAETIDGAFNQSYDNMEIIISDDCSGDNTSQIIQEKVKNYTGDKRVIVNINKTNMGIVKHMNKLFSMANGDIIATNPGDDVSTPNRIADSVEYFKKDDNLQLVTFSRIDIDENSNVIEERKIPADKYFSINRDFLLKPNFMTTGAAVAFRKDLLDKFGLLNEDAQTEDSTMRFRALLVGQVLHSSKVGVLYRKHGNNISIGLGQFRLKSELISKQYIKDIDIAVKYGLKPELRELLIEKTDHYINCRAIDKRMVENSKNLIIRFYLKLKKIYLQKLYERKVKRSL